jgi:hypothetical protein
MYGIVNTLRPKINLSFIRFGYFEKVTCNLYRPLNSKTTVVFIDERDVTRYLFERG